MGRRAKKDRYSNMHAHNPIGIDGLAHTHMYLRGENRTVGHTWVLVCVESEIIVPVLFISVPQALFHIIGPPPGC